MKRALLISPILAGIIASIIALGSTQARVSPPEPQAEPTTAERIVLPLVVTEPPFTERDREGKLWAPYLEWQLRNTSYSGNPYDLAASVTFTHTSSGERRTTGMFYIGDDTWAFRFTGTRPGEWRYTTSSGDDDLDGHSGRALIGWRDGLNGFVETEGDKWVHGATGRAFVPQFVMAPSIERIDDAWIDWAIQTFMIEHGFSGFHVSIQCRWFDLNAESCAEVDTPNPDRRTLERLERLITRTYAAGGVVHIWKWGDSDRGQNPSRWGLNGTVDRRVQRYVAARLGPIPGWTMGYGFDLWEWVSGAQLTTWHTYMHGQLGWDHPLGARASTNQLNQLSEVMDYASYEQHKPSLNLYRQTIAARPDRPAFSEDRFRIRDGGLAKDYTLDETRRGLWHSLMAGGVANIWGNLAGGRDSDFGSLPYPNVAQIKTYAIFAHSYFRKDLVPCSGSSSACLSASDGSRYLFYREDATALTLNLSGAPGELRAVAIDTRRPYAPIDLGLLPAAVQTWNAPYASDWAIAVGD